MKKTLILSCIILLYFQIAQAQKQDTLLYFMKNDGRMVTNKAEADYFLFIMPADKSSGKVLYPVFEYYPNGNRKLVSSSKYNTQKALRLEGACVTYYPNGKRKDISTLKDGVAVGELTQYYPNGKLYDIIKCMEPSGILLITCRDTAGKILSDNGKGYWLEYIDDRDKLIATGMVLDGLKEGEWTGATADSGRFSCFYEKGKLTSGNGYDKAGKEYPFTEVKTEPVFKGEKYAFSDFIKQNIIYPKQVLEHIRVTLYIRFTIEKDGTITGVNTDVLYAPGDDSLSNDFKLMCTAAINVIKTSPPWLPGTLYGMPVRTRITFPVNFNNL